MEITRIIIKKTGIEGSLYHISTSSLDPSKQYYTRYKGNGGGYVGRYFKGSELEIIKTF